MTLRVIAKLAEVKGDAWFIAHRFGVVARMKREDIAGFDLAAAAVVGNDLHSLPRDPGERDPPLVHHVTKIPRGQLGRGRHPRIFLVDSPPPGAG